MGLELQGDDSSIKGAVGIPETPGQALSHQDYGDYSILLSRFSHILRPSQYSLHHQRKVQGPESGVRRIYPTSGGFIRRTIHMEGSSPEDLSVGPSVINRSSPEDLSVGPSIWKEGL